VRFLVIYEAHGRAVQMSHECIAIDTVFQLPVCLIYPPVHLRVMCILQHIIVTNCNCNVVSIDPAGATGTEARRPRREAGPDGA
jgi:hypothetical protein